MHTARGRLAIAALVLLAFGAFGGLVQASRSSAPASAPAAANTTVDSTGRAARTGATQDASALDFAASTAQIDLAADALAGRFGQGLAKKIWPKVRQLVHAEATVDLPKKGLVTYVVDHGTVDSVGAGRFDLSQKAGRSASVTTDAQTKIRKDGKRQQLSAVKAGDEVLAVSIRNADGTLLAKWVIVPKAGS